MRLGLAEQADVGAGDAQRLVDTDIANTDRLQLAVDDGAGRGAAHLHVHRQAQNGARVQFELRQALAGQGDQAGVVRARADLAEPDLVAAHEQLHAKNAAPAERLRDAPGDVLRPGQGGVAHELRLPAFHVIAVHLTVADRLAKAGFGVAVHAQAAHRQQRDFVVERNLLLDDQARLTHPAGVQRVLPGPFQFRGLLYPRLALAGRGHDRLHETGEPDVGRRDAQLLQAVDEGVARGRQAQFLGGQAADAFAVHGQLRGAGGGNDLGQAVGFDLHQHVGGYGLDLRHDEGRPLALDQRPQRGAVGHVDHMRAVRHLLAGRVRIAVHRDGLHAQALQGDDDFLAELAGAQQHDAGGIGGKRGT
ncbi:MAG: hypothetical protein OZX49_01543 [Immundisolibacter sp.]|nr:hypothetical protein [Immundisolibacter sp.]